MLLREENELTVWRGKGMGVTNLSLLLQHLAVLSGPAPLHCETSQALLTLIGSAGKLSCFTEYLLLQLLLSTLGLHSCSLRGRRRRRRRRRRKC